jgi:hypothetical protein
MTDLIVGLKPRGLVGPATRDRVLDRPHFEFRGVPSAAAHEARRASRLEERRRRLAE